MHLQSLAPENQLEQQVYGWFFEIAKPDPDLTVSEWADENRVLSSKASAAPGKWRTSKTPYLREIMDCLSVNSPVEDVTFIAGSQIGKTEGGLNWIGYVIDYAPGPMLMVQPTVEMAKKVSKQRLAPLIQESPSLSERVKESRSRDSGNTLMSKEFPGGLLMLAGANSAASLASMPIRYLFMDEIDRYPGDVDEEGSPIDLAVTRTNNFSRRKILKTSTPTIKDSSAIEAEYLDTEQSKYFVPCPQCGFMHVLEWKHFIIPKFDDGTYNWRGAHMVCPDCGGVIENHHKTDMLNGGEWRATCPEKIYKKKRGFHISSLYAPVGWKNWQEIAREWLLAQGNPLKLKTFINTRLGETWEEKGEKVDHTGLMARREDYGFDPIPEGVAIITCGVDVQRDRIELEYIGWGKGEESWSLDYVVLYGDTLQPEIYTRLNLELMQRTFRHPKGFAMRPVRTLVDSGDGERTQQVYDYTRPREAHQIYACKGMSGDDKPVAGKPSKVGTDGNVTLIPVGTYQAKDLVVGRLKIEQAGPGFCHFPKRYEQEYFEQITAEVVIKKVDPKGYEVREWHKKRARNEALDCRVYGTAALYSTGINVDTVADMLSNPAQMMGGRKVRGTTQ